MNPIRKLRWIIALGAVGYVIVTGIWFEARHHEMTGMVIGGQKIDFNDPRNRGREGAPEPVITGQAYQEGEWITTREFPNGRLVTLKMLSAQDPKEFIQGGGADRAPSAKEQIQTKAAAYLEQLAAGKP